MDAALFADLVEEERKKKTPKSWSAIYAEGYDDALCQILEWLEAYTDIGFLPNEV